MSAAHALATNPVQLARTFSSQANTVQGIVFKGDRVIATFTVELDDEGRISTIQKVQTPTNCTRSPTELYESDHHARRHAARLAIFLGVAKWPSYEPSSLRAAHDQSAIAGERQSGSRETRLGRATPLPRVYRQRRGARTSYLAPAAAPCGSYLKTNTF